MSSPAPFSAFDNPPWLNRSTDQTGRAPASGDIDRVLRTIAENDTKYCNHFVQQSNSVVLALDAITRWIDRAEQRLTDLTERNTQTERLMAHVTTLATPPARHSSIPDFAMGRGEEPAPEAAHRVRPMDARRLAEPPRHAPPPAAILERVTNALQDLDRKTARLEERDRTPDAFADKIQGLAATLDTRLRPVARETDISGQYFDRMTGQIGALAEELRQKREMRRAAAQPAFPAQPDPLQAEAETGFPALPADAPPLPAPASDRAAEDFSTTNDGLRIVSGLMKAARQALRSESATERDAIPRLDRYFRRSTAFGKS